MAATLWLVRKAGIAVLVLLFLLVGNSYALSKSERFNYSGKAYFQAGMYDRAIEEFSKSIDASPNYEAYVFRGKAYSFNKDYDRAISDFTEAIEIKSDDVTAYLERGSAYILKGWYNQAFYDLNLAIKMSPIYGPAYLYRANAYYSVKEYKNAWADLKQAKILDQPVSDKMMADFQKKALGR